jgi:uncharacterized protein (TIRG00374 family)
MKARKGLVVAARLAVSALLMAWLYSRVDLGELRRLLTDLRPAVLVALFGLLLFNSWISALKWRILLAADGIRLPLRGLLASYLVGTFFNVFLPSNIGGDAYRIYDVARRTARPVNTAASVFADRLSGFCALAVLGLLFPLLGSGLLLHARRVMLLPLAVFAAVAAMAWLLWQRRLLEWLLERCGLYRARRLRATVEQFLDSMHAYRRGHRVVTAIMAVSFVFQFTVIVFAWVLAMGIGLRIPFAYFCVFMPLVSLLEAVPVTIYGLGLRDAGYVFFFSRIGRTDEQALGMAVLYVVLTLVYASVGGLIFALRRHRAGRAGASPADRPACPPQPAPSHPNTEEAAGPHRS